MVKVEMCFDDLLKPLGFIETFNERKTLNARDEEFVIRDDKAYDILLYAIHLRYNYWRIKSKLKKIIRFDFGWQPRDMFFLIITNCFSIENIPTENSQGSVSIQST